MLYKILIAAVFFISINASVYARDNFLLLFDCSHSSEDKNEEANVKINQKNLAAFLGMFGLFSDQGILQDYKVHLIKYAENSNIQESFDETNIKNKLTVFSKLINLKDNRPVKICKNKVGNRKITNLYSTLSQLLGNSRVKKSDYASLNAEHADDGETIIIVFSRGQDTGNRNNFSKGLDLIVDYLELNQIGRNFNVSAFIGIGFDDTWLVEWSAAFSQTEGIKTYFVANDQINNMASFKEIFRFIKKDL